MSISSQSQLPSRVFHYNFSDSDQLGEAIKFSKLKANQYSLGKLQVKLNFAHLDNFQFLDGISNRTLRFKAEQNLIDKVEFSMVQTKNKEGVISHGSPVKEQTLFGFNYCQGTDLFLPENSNIKIIRINPNLFHSLAKQMGYDCFTTNFFAQNAIHFEPAYFQTLKIYYQQISWILENNPSLCVAPPFQSLIEEDFYPLLIDTLGKSLRQKRQKIKMYRRYHLVKKAEEIAQSYLDKPLTLKQLCNDLETSSSALCYGFQEIFEMSPMAYVKVQRLNGVRRALKNANPETTMVMSIAQKWGFWSAGHFSRDYKQMFGELPSQTLQRSFS